MHPKKLLLSKWTALRPLEKQKHFLVVKVITPEPPEAPVEWVELESIYSKNLQRIRWRELLDNTVWRQGWL